MLIKSRRTEARLHVRARDHRSNATSSVSYISVESFIENDNENAVGKRGIRH